MYPLELTIYQTKTHTSQYINFKIHTTWIYKISWIWSLVTRAKQICIGDLLPSEIQNIKKFASWNGYPKFIRNKLIKQILSTPSRQEHLYNYNDIVKLYINLTYLGGAVEQPFKSCIQKLKSNVWEEIQVKFIVRYNTTKLRFFTNTKDCITKLASSFVVYHFCCPRMSPRLY